MRAFFFKKKKRKQHLKKTQQTKTLESKGICFLSKHDTDSCYIHLATKYLYFAFRSVVQLLIPLLEHSNQM